MRVLKFFATGAIGISVNLSALHTLVSWLGVYYLSASVIAVSISTIVGFALQKYWTFEEHSRERAREQFALYVIIAVTNIGANTLIVYIVTGIFGIHYLIAQATGVALVALWSYLLYRHTLFKPLETPPQI